MTKRLGPEWERVADAIPEKAKPWEIHNIRNGFYFGAYAMFCLIDEALSDQTKTSEQGSEFIEEILEELREFMSQEAVLAETFAAKRH